MFTMAVLLINLILAVFLLQSGTSPATNEISDLLLGSCAIMGCLTILWSSPSTNE